jgi:hypothetical protein
VTHDPQRAIIFYLRGLELGALVAVDVPQDDVPHCVAGPGMGAQDRPGLRRDGGHGLVKLAAGFPIHVQPPAHSTLTGIKRGVPVGHLPAGPARHAAATAGHLPALRYPRSVRLL